MRRVLIGVTGAAVAGLGAAAIAQAGTVRATTTATQTQQTQQTRATKSWQITKNDTTERFYGITATGPKDAWLAGLTYKAKTLRPLMMHWNGHTWASTTLPTGVQNTGVFDVKAVSPSNIWAFALSSKSAFILHENGKRWTESGSWPAAGAMAGKLLPLSPANVWSFDAISPSLTHPMPKVDIRRYDGKSWRAVSFPQAVTGADGTNKSAWAVGYTSGLPHPAVSHWNGTRWLTVKLPALGPGSLMSVVAQNAKSVWAVGTSGGKGLVLHWDGAHWKATTTAGALQSVSLDGAGGLWVTTIDGKALHYENGRWTNASLPAQGPGLTAQMLLPALVPGTKTLWATGMVRHGLTGEAGLLLRFG
jgi:hypothetical protein